MHPRGRDQGTADQGRGRQLMDSQAGIFRFGTPNAVTSVNGAVCGIGNHVPRPAPAKHFPRPADGLRGGSIPGADLWHLSQNRDSRVSELVREHTLHSRSSKRIRDVMKGTSLASSLCVVHPVESCAIRSGSSEYAPVAWPGQEGRLGIMCEARHSTRPDAPGFWRTKMLGCVRSLDLSGLQADQSDREGPWPRGDRDRL
jgi:hypothetical protein